jgi:hypothetical protein
MIHRVPKMRLLGTLWIMGAQFRYPMDHGEVSLGTLWIMGDDFRYPMDHESRF